MSIESYEEFVAQQMDPGPAMPDGQGFEPTYLCDYCDGKGAISGTRHVNYGNRAEWKSYTEACPRCGGSGGLTGSDVARIDLGFQARADRKARGLTLSQAAAERGMTAPEYSAFERGVAP